MTRFAMALVFTTMTAAVPAYSDEQSRRPSSPPPEFAAATLLEDGTLKLEYTRFSLGLAPRETKVVEVDKVIDGKPVKEKMSVFETWKTFEPDHETKMLRCGFKLVRGGVTLDDNAVKEALKHRTEVVVAEWGPDLDPFYVQFLKPDATVLVLDLWEPLREDVFKDPREFMKRKAKEMNAHQLLGPVGPVPFQQVAPPLEEPKAAKDEPSDAADSR